MPQTEEHLAIVELLGVRRGIPVITKRDLADSEWLALVRSEVSTRLSASRVRWDESIATSVVTGEGLPELRDALRRVAGDLVERPADDLFRLPIDRVFAVAGAGTVVTGSTWSGSVAVGEAVRLLPLGREARVRSIEIHGETAERAAPGRRTALALVGVDKSELARGHVAVTGSGWHATRLLDVAAELLPTARKPLGSRTRVRVHLGTAEVLARAIQTPAIAPGQRGLARLVLETPLVARVAVEQGPAVRLGVFAVEAGLMGLATESLAVRLGVSPGRVTRVIAEAGETVLTSADIVVDRQAVVAAAGRLAEVVRRYHEEHPLDPGMSLQALRAAVGTPAPPSAVMDAVLAFGVKSGAVEVAGSVARRPRWRPALDARVTDAGEKLARRLADARWQVPTVAELEREFPGLPVRALLSHFARTGTAEPIDAERFAAKGALAEFRAALEAALAELGSATPAELRDRLGLTRKYLIPLLEWADRHGVTRRAGDARVLARLTAGKGGS